ncbi:hypothetical protein [Streptomyces beigongshangae]|uniref:hypothetical protein n=1 Tax=Streptomyces beigongshangae TaxID=2841597 RepID=UPI001C86550A|nr:hypothetical protein [Streptomyces sp. REN17]
MAQPARAVPVSPARNRAPADRGPVTRMLLATLFTVLGVLGLQGGPAGALPGAPAPVAVAAHQGPAPAAYGSPAAHTATAPTAPTATGSTRSADDTCTAPCGRPPRAGRAAPAEWHVPPPGGVCVPPGLLLPLPEPGPPLPAAPGAFTPPQHCAHHSGRGPPPPTGS